jgi:hypothetical protein
MVKQLLTKQNEMENKNMWGLTSSMYDLQQPQMSAIHVYFMEPRLAPGATFHSTESDD